MLARVVRRTLGGVRRPLRAHLVRPFTTGSRVAWDAKKEEKQGGDFSDMTAYGIDRSNPEYAPFMGNHTWKEAAYPNMADHSWKGWEDLPAPYKYYEVKVNPEDVENKGFFWDLMTNWKTALPLTLGVSIPLFAYDVIEIDDHLALAGIFWTSIFLLKRYTSDGLWNLLDEEFKGIRADLYKAEEEYNEALKDNLVLHEKVQHIPDVIRTINRADRQLRAVEAEAATRRAKLLERNRMVAMLDFLVAMQGSDVGEGAAPVAAMQASEAVSRRLREDAKLQQAVLKDALNALSEGEERFPTLQSVLEEELKAAEERPPEVDVEAEEKEERKLRELFAKRFGFTDTHVSQAMLDRAKEDRVEWAILSARVGGKTPEVGMPLVQKMPIDYELQ